MAISLHHDVWDFKNNWENDMGLEDGGMLLRHRSPRSSKPGLKFICQIDIERLILIVRNYLNLKLSTRSNHVERK